MAATSVRGQLFGRIHWMRHGRRRVGGASCSLSGAERKKTSMACSPALIRSHLVSLADAQQPQGRIYSCWMIPCIFMRQFKVADTAWGVRGARGLQQR